MPNKTQIDIIFKKLGYVPSDEQAAVHYSPARTRLAAGGERSGKSYLAANDLLARMWEGKLYWLVAADYERTRAEFNYIQEGLDKLGWPYEATKYIDPGEILVEGGFRIVTKSSKDPRKLAMEAPDGIIGCESSQLEYEDFLRIRGRLAERRGWALLEGSFESSLGWYPALYKKGLAATPDFASFSLPTWSNRKVFPGGREDPEILSLERDLPPEYFLERFGGVPCPPKGLVLPEFNMATHTGIGGMFEFDQTLDVEIWVDPGFQHFYAVEVVQKKGDIVYVIDEIYERGLVTQDIITICQKRPWWPNVKGGAIDVAATQHQGQAPVQQIWLKDSGIFLRSKKVRIKDGVERFKTALKVHPITGSPAILINLSKCKGLISELGGLPNPVTGQEATYKWRLDRDNHVIGDVPDDKNNDAVKAVTYGLIDMLGYTPRKEGKSKTRYY